MRWVGARPGRILFAFGAVTAFISAWISNTATTAMMYAIGMSILGFLFKPGSTGTVIHRRYATGLMLMTSFSASIGGLATPIGTPPNLIGLHFLEAGGHAQITFFHWAILGVPVVVVLYLFLFGYMNFFCRAGVREIEGGSEMLRREKEALGPLTAGQASALIAFLVTAALWILPGVVAVTKGETSEPFQLVRDRIPESVAALVGAALLFLLPGKKGERALTWKEAAKIDWGIVLLYGGGFALGDLAGKTKLAEAVGRAMTDLIPAGGGLGLLVASTLVAALVSEATSNTASAQIVVPVVISIAKAMGADPVEPALGATFGSSLGFMLPVSTPCNAIVYGSGYIPLGRMIRYGFLLDVVGVAVVVALVKLLSPWVNP
jgi:sodium-dependent dicarboxylate transporter 2/3/5